MATLTPTITPTRLPSRTPAASETPVEPLQEAQYLYDGDNNLVKSVVNGKITYYPGRHYQQNDDTINKYYTLGRQFVAVRTIQDETDTLKWILDDHLGSTSVTASEDGTWNSEIKYTAYGEVRWKSGLTPTSYRYTAQLEQPEAGLYFYVARFYDPALRRFIQADTLIPDAGAFDRYAYVTGSPIRYNDPSGHGVDCGIGEPNCDRLGDRARWEKYISNQNNGDNIIDVVHPDGEAISFGFQFAIWPGLPHYVASIDFVRTPKDIAIFKSEWVPDAATKSNIPNYYGLTLAGPRGNWIKKQGAYHKWNEGQNMLPEISVYYGRSALYGKDLKEKGWVAFEGPVKHYGGYFGGTALLSLGGEYSCSTNPTSGEINNALRAFSWSLNFGPSLPLGFQTYITNSEKIAGEYERSSWQYWASRILFP